MQPLKKGFSLIELLIVVALITIIYGLSLSSIKAPSVIRSGLDLINLPDKMREFDGYVKLSCVGERCEECRLTSSDREDLVEPFMLFAEAPEVFEYDKNGYKKERRFAEPICFEVEKFENRSISQTFFKYKNNFYAYYPLVQPVVVSAEELELAEIAPTDTSRYFNEND